MAGLRRRDNRVVLHFDYDCFYAAVFEKENPALRSLPFAVQQKQIIVTCNYEARRRGLYKLQLVREARQQCPDVICPCALEDVPIDFDSIALGEDLNRFRDASKENYDFLRSHIWSGRAERLGFDEVFLDVTDMVDYNIKILNVRDLQYSFFHLDRGDPTVGFSYDASSLNGHAYPSQVTRTSIDIHSLSDQDTDLIMRLHLGSHLAEYLRHKLDDSQGFTSTVGIGTNKLLSKLVGNINKPRGQTTLVPPYEDGGRQMSNIQEFLDGHDIGKIPGIGFKTSQKLRAYHLKRPADFDAGLVYGGTRENITVKDIRLTHGVSLQTLQGVLGAPGMPKDLPEKVWGLLHGIDDTEVGMARDVPQQISIEDSYIKLNDLSEVIKELTMLSKSLISRMRIDLTMDRHVSDLAKETSQEMNDEENDSKDSMPISWTARPRVLRLSTRPRPPVNADGSRQRSFARISRSGAMPSFVFNLSAEINALAQRLVTDTIMPLFRKLHPEPSGWDLSLVNLCASSMTMSASDRKEGCGRDIAKMFQAQETVLKQWSATEDGDYGKQHQRLCVGLVDTMTCDGFDVTDSAVAKDLDSEHVIVGSEDIMVASQSSPHTSDVEDIEIGSACSDEEVCVLCGAKVPGFAIMAHARLHDDTEAPKHQH